jgi:NhaA family Na+:H+ antiporter
MATIAMILANSDYKDAYFHFFHSEVGFHFNGYKLDMSLTHWINDGLMAIFFLIVGIEIKRELIFGELSSIKKASFPIVGAIGGMVVPLSIYIAFNPTHPDILGFGIPMATDIAFALGILMLLGDRIPLSLKIFLTTLAVVDDLGAIVVIAVFYSSNIDYISIMYAIGVCILLYSANRIGIKKMMVYMILGTFLWLFIHQSGIHATMAGVILAIFIPVAPRLKSANFLYTMQTKIEKFDNMDNRDSILLNRSQQDILESIYETYRDVQNPMLRLEHSLHPVTAYIIMPLFALANAGVEINTDIDYFSSISLGIVLGLVLGKPLGIFSFSYLFARFGVVQKPIQLEWNQIFGVSLLGGVGFTMSILVSSLAFGAEVIDTAKIAVLVGSTVAGLLGLIYILKSLSKSKL